MFLSLSLSLVERKTLVKANKGDSMEILLDLEAILTMLLAWPTGSGIRILCVNGCEGNAGCPVEFKGVRW